MVFILLLFLTFEVHAEITTTDECVRLVLEQIHTTVTDNKFNFHRSLFDYRTTLASPFSEKLDELTENDIYVDMGAGTATAQIQYLIKRHDQSKPLPLNIAVVVNRPKRIFGRGSEHDTSKRIELLNSFLRGEDVNVTISSRFRYLEGRKIEEIPLNEIAQERSVSLITDYYGPISYSNNLDQILLVYGKLLDHGRSLFVRHDIDNIQISKPGVSTVLSLPDFIRDYTKGFNVKYPLAGSFEVIRTTEPLSIPRLRLLDVTGTTPPKFVYEIID